ncbi:unnamed protein product [Cyprideis torosa]|uniref:Uncharacterized protein n=1 Tax=Cyprideis torosa TaxID=163714 RepID=A0A7R8WE63_9CRUS|nr:unnamed protein product [Cyprideis torosa]CAG0895451.1 unnamed protein product [Cyprideis torosa]
MSGRFCSPTVRRDRQPAVSHNRTQQSKSGDKKRAAPKRNPLQQKHVQMKPEPPVSSSVPPKYDAVVADLRQRLKQRMTPTAELMCSRTEAHAKAASSKKHATQLPASHDANGKMQKLISDADSVLLQASLARGSQSGLATTASRSRPLVGLPLWLKPGVPNTTRARDAHVKVRAAATDPNPFR